MKIGAIVSVYHHELFIKPHLDMLRRGVDEIVVLAHQKPIQKYVELHGIPQEPDRSEQIVREYFPDIQVQQVSFPDAEYFDSKMVNEGLQYLKDCDIVLRLDPDMFFTDEVWDKVIQAIRETPKSNCFHMNFAANSTNYYMTDSFDHGLRDAQEVDLLAWRPTRLITNVMDCPWEIHSMLTFPEFHCHHFRGWLKPKTSPNPGWLTTEFAQLGPALYGNDGTFFVCPAQIRKKLQEWKKELNK